MASAVSTVAGRLGSALALFLSHMILAKALPVAAYGSYVVAAAVAFLLGKLSQFGLGTIVLRDLQTLPITGKNGRVLLHTSALAVALGTVCTSALYLVLCSLLGGVPAAQHAILVVTWSAMWAASSFSAEVLRAKHAFFWANFVGGQSGGVLSNAITLAIFSVALATGTLRLESALWGSLIAAAVATVSGVILASCVARFDQHGAGAKSSHFSQMLRDGFPIVVVELIVVGILHIETLVISESLSLSEAAVFSAVRRIITLVCVPLLLVNTTIRPFVAELHTQHQLSKLTMLVRGSSTVALIVAMPIFICLVVFANPILASLFGQQYVAGATALQVLALSSLVFVGSGSCGLLLQMTGNQQASMYTSLFFGLLYITCAPYAIIAFGLTGAAVAAAILVCATNLTQLFVSRLLLGIWTCATLRPRHSAIISQQAV